MEELIRLLLKGSPAVSGITSHVNFGSLPQGAGYPAIVLNTISSNDGVTLDGPMRLSTGRVQVDCYAATYEDAKQLSRAVMSVLHGYRGGALQGVFHAGSRDSREAGPTEANRPFRVSIDFETVFNEG